MSSSYALVAGAAAVDISPTRSLFLFGYPNVERNSTGVNDPLLCSALYLSDGNVAQLFVACDVIFVERGLALRAKACIERATGIPAAHILISATHTHSAPMTMTMLSNAADPRVPAIDPAFVQTLEDGIVAAAVQAYETKRPAELGVAVADASAVGSNRLDPSGPSDPTAPVMSVRCAQSHAPIAVLLVCSMHPTVLRETSTLVSGDFPGLARKYLQERTFGSKIPVIYHTGPCGNLSPRHVVRENTVAEATRLGYLLGAAVEAAMRSIEYSSTLRLSCRSDSLRFPLRKFPTVDAADELLHQAEADFRQLQAAAADPRTIRTAECKLFGAEETVALSRASEQGFVAQAAEEVLPAELSIFQIGDWHYVGWPGEQFVEFSLEIKARYPQCCIISMANGDLQGYLVTADAVRDKTYESLNAIFESPASGNLLVGRTLELLSQN
ncbi:neutral/alkaline non-lysosomal ceramidase N-terminal domain-containing protein [Lacipirellula parvula]|uniref:Neutral/alkaline non-lysosomal ceramidase N-terminal domain-containing protein n=1 Tax=Lacipirellula parvula TaxID=2650471 RepID=A0A5K7X5X6_9BACT|nr:neutral/alkaline non-lysosomal ceramidase N-terminal domain-containing protein [Lacipirellula parvula]BBO31257.1 hypothetical protein PLANPX_0869 [Lacipirellula parvula]